MSLRRIGQSGTWRGLLRKGGGPKKDSNTAWTFFTRTFLYQWHSGGTLVDPTLQDTVLLPATSPSTSTTIWKLPRHALHHPIRIASVVKMPRKGETGFFIAVHLVSIHLHKQRDYDVTEAQDCSLQIKLENTSQESVLGHFESCAEERIDVLSNKIQRNHPSQDSPSSVYWESGGNEFWRSTV